jgi:hypothetical protein
MMDEGRSELPTLNIDNFEHLAQGSGKRVENQTSEISHQHRTTEQ